MDSRWHQLHDVALRQHGHFTTGQAEDVGLTRPALHYQLKNGFLTRPERGVYRFTTYPPSEHEREAILMLWSRLNEGVAFSHETALNHFELGDAFPSKYHLTVPTSFRVKPPTDVVLHKAKLTANDVHEETILHYTTPERTILDLLRDYYPLDQLQAAYEDSLARGLIRRGALVPGSRQVKSYLELLPKIRQPELLHRLAAVTEGAE